MYILAGGQCCYNILFLAPTIDREELTSNPFGQENRFPLRYSLSATLLIIATALVIVARYVSVQRFTTADRRNQNQRLFRRRNRAYKEHAPKKKYSYF